MSVTSVNKATQPTETVEQSLQRHLENDHLDFKPLIKTGLKHFLASKLNGFTGGKFKCLRNWEGETAATLLQSINKTFSPIVTRELQKIQGEVPKKINEVYVGLKKQAEEKAGMIMPESWGKAVVDNIARWSGIEASQDICQKFLTLACDVIIQDSDQTVNRLLTIAGVLYTGDIRPVEEGGAVSQTQINTFIEKFKEECLNHFFLTHKGPDGRDQPSILSNILRSKLGENTRLLGFIEKFVIGLNVKDFVDNFLTKHILIEKRFKAFGPVGEGYEKLILKGVSIFVDNKKGDALKLDTFLNDFFISSSIKRQLDELSMAYEGSKLSQVTTVAGKAFLPALLKRLNDQESILNMPKEALKGCLIEAGKEAGVVLVSEGAIKTVEFLKDSATSLSSRLVKIGAKIGEVVSDFYTRGVDAGIAFWNWVRGKDQKEEAKQAKEAEKDFRVAIKDYEMLEEEIDDFIKGITEEAISTSASEAVSNTSPVRREVEQKEEESTSVMGAVSEVAAGVVKGTGKVAWWCVKGLCRVAAAAATGVYKCVAGSSAEAEPVSEEAPKDEADVPGTEDKSMPEATSKEGAKETEKKNKESHWYNPLSWW